MGSLESVKESRLRTSLYPEARKVVSTTDFLGLHTLRYRVFSIIIIIKVITTFCCRKLHYTTQNKQRYTTKLCKIGAEMTSRKRCPIPPLPEPGGPFWSFLRRGSKSASLNPDSRNLRLTLLSVPVPSTCLPASSHPRSSVASLSSAWGEI